MRHATVLIAAIALVGGSGVEASADCKPYDGQLMTASGVIEDFDGFTEAAFYTAARIAQGCRVTVIATDITRLAGACQKGSRFTATGTITTEHMLRNEAALLASSVSCR